MRTQPSIWPSLVSEAVTGLKASWSWGLSPPCWNVTSIALWFLLATFLQPTMLLLFRLTFQALVSHTAFKLYFPIALCRYDSVGFAFSSWCIGEMIICIIMTFSLVFHFVRVQFHHPQCIDQLTVVQAELQESVKELTKSRKKYQEAETMAQAVRDKAELDAKYETDHCLW